jgi:uracil-DNA glycosylase
MARVGEEVAIVQPKIIVAMGDDAFDALCDLDLPLARSVSRRVGEVQALTPSIELLCVPDIDHSLDDELSKREFWSAFRVLGEWHAELPPY